MIVDRGFFILSDTSPALRDPVAVRQTTERERLPSHSSRR